jgi:hypothetical protein
LEKSPVIRQWLAAGGAAGVVPPGYAAVRSILFDKRPGANWNVAWPQDLTITVRERREAEGFGPWSTKDGTPHVQAPAALLERMLTLRLHLDDTGSANGALRVYPGSHRHGRLDPPFQGEEVLCEARAGDALLMRPLLLHASSKSTDAARLRRVIHIEFAPADALPAPLKWAE